MNMWILKIPAHEAATQRSTHQLRKPDVDKQEAVYFPLKNSLHSSFVARPIYSKKLPQLVPMSADSRYGLICVAPTPKNVPLCKKKKKKKNIFLSK